MGKGDEYRAKAAECDAHGRAEASAEKRLPWLSRKLAFLRLAETADKNQQLKTEFDAPPTAQPVQQQQGQSERQSD
jgi:hypothetical protein